MENFGARLKFIIIWWLQKFEKSLCCKSWHVEVHT